MNIAKHTLMEVTRRLRGVPSTHATLPVLSCIRITRHAGGIRFSATNLEQFLSVDLPDAPTVGELARKLATLRAAREAADFCVPSSTLDRCAKAADKGTDITITPDPKGGAQITYQQGGITANVPAAAPKADEFPADPAEGYAAGPPTPFDRVLAAICRAKPCVSYDPTRYVLNGVFWGENGDIAATDGRRLHMEEHLPAAPADSIIPTDALRFIEPGMAASSLSKPKVKNTTAHPAPALLFTGEIGGLTVRLVTKVIEGNFPNYRQVIPSEPAKLTCRIDNEATRKAILQAAGNFRHAKPGHVSLRFDPAASSLTFSMNVPDVGRSEFTVTAILKGSLPRVRPANAPHIAFTPQYLADALLHHDTIHFRDSESPATFTGLKPHHQYILMPMRVMADSTAPAPKPEPAKPEPKPEPVKI